MQSLVKFLSCWVLDMFVVIKIVLSFNLYSMVQLFTNSLILSGLAFKLYWQVRGTISLWLISPPLRHNITLSSLTNALGIVRAQEQLQPVLWELWGVSLLILMGGLSLASQLFSSHTQLSSAFTTTDHCVKLHCLLTSAFRDVISCIFSRALVISDMKVPDTPTQQIVPINFEKLVCLAAHFKKTASFVCSFPLTPAISCLHTTSPKCQHDSGNYLG